MTRLAGVFLSACIALPVLFAAQDQDVDQLGREAVRLMNARADEIEALAKDPSEKNRAAAKEKLTKIVSDIKALKGKHDKLPAADQKLFEEKYKKDVDLAAERGNKARAKLPADLREPDQDGAKTESPQEITKRIQENMKKANDRLKMNDPGKETVKTQEDIMKDLEELLKQKNPNDSGGGGGGGGSNQGGGSSSSGSSGNKGNGGAPSGGNGGGSANKGGDGGQGGGQDKKDPMANKDQNNKQPGGGQKPDPKNGGGGAGNPKDKDKEKGKGGGFGDKGLDGNLRNPDTKIEEWGQLPKTKRQEMETYARDQFMRRYENDLRQYYRAIAEQSRRD